MIKHIDPSLLWQHIQTQLTFRAWFFIFRLLFFFHSLLISLSVFSPLFLPLLLSFHLCLSLFLFNSIFSSNIFQSLTACFCFPIFPVFLFFSPFILKALGSNGLICTVQLRKLFKKINLKTRLWRRSQRITNFKPGWLNILYVCSISRETAIFFLNIEKNRSVSFIYISIIFFFIPLISSFTLLLSLSTLLILYLSIFLYISHSLDFATCPSILHSFNLNSVSDTYGMCPNLHLCSVYVTLDSFSWRKERSWNRTTNEHEK